MHIPKGRSSSPEVVQHVVVGRSKSGMGTVVAKSERESTGNKAT